MCGIGFIINYGESFSVSLIGAMFKEMANRGDDASGIYFERKEGSKNVQRIIKAPIESEQFWKATQVGDNASLTLCGDEKLVLLHTRARTRGTEYDNNNNMPIYSSKFVLVHNGIVTNAKKEGYPYLGQVDSEEILAQIDGGLAKGLKKITGSMAIVVRPRSGRFLWLYRNSNPLEVVYFQKHKLLVGCSSSRYIPGVFGAATTKPFTEIFKRETEANEVPAHTLFQVNVEKPEILDCGTIKLDPIVYEKGEKNEHKTTEYPVRESWYRGDFGLINRCYAGDGD